jgi:uncharacterized SAM-binding protein YcdF (DUF218 family)
MYAFKQFVGALCHPGAISLLAASLGFLMRRSQRPRTATSLFWFAALFGWLTATPLVGSWLLAPLERQYPPLAAPPDDIHYVVVLGSSYLPRDGIPVTAAIDDAGLKRLVEGVRLQRLLPGSTLVVSGGATSGGYAPAVGNAMLAQSIGVPEESLRRLLRPLDTRGEAAEVSALIGSSPFLLVTSAGHMPRAMEYMRRAGANPVAAPTGQKTGNGPFYLRTLIPNSDGLRMTEDAIHEYLGWLALKTEIQ